MKVYNVWAQIEIADTEGDFFENVEGEEWLVGKFATLQEAQDHSAQLEKEWDSIKEDLE